MHDFVVGRSQIDLNPNPNPNPNPHSNLRPEPNLNGDQVEIMLEAFATQLEDLLDRVGGLRETVATH